VTETESKRNAIPGIYYGAVFDLKSQVGDASPTVQHVASLPTRQTAAEPESRAPAFQEDDRFRD
jgi:hypothetical protein